MLAIIRYLCLITFITHSNSYTNAKMSRQKVIFPYFNKIITFTS